MPTPLESDQPDVLQTTHVMGLSPRLPAPASPAAAPEALDVALRINGAEHRLQLDTRTTLLDALREHLGLSGTKVCP
jgi:hypothetical protein